MELLFDANARRGEFSAVAVMVGQNVEVIERFELLTSERLRLEPISYELARLIESGDTHRLHPAQGWPQAGTKNGVRLALEKGHPAGWLVRQSDQVIGDCGIRAQVDDDLAVEIGYGLSASFRGQGYGTELVIVISQWLLAQPGVATVRAHTNVSNVASRRVLEKAGFTLFDQSTEECLYELRQ